MAALGLLVGLVFAWRRKAWLIHIALATLLQVVTFYAQAIANALTQGNFFLTHAFLIMPFALYFGRPVRTLFQTDLLLFGACSFFALLLIFTGRF
ncbi:hypothetical protein GCM10008956_16000 [Deinococcus arenae]|uniref:Uncharacterized protein n=2 Tax=Deinococcus arenae TaxID=1452751 RepID=A0A8H9L7G8_9DEIO|nr:hypothetical protein GCM10008956_16000 [Deinococcus arenae]